MSKHEILSFKNRYINYLKNNNGDYNICDWLQNAVDFERPDGYYFDYNTKLLVIFEHFEIDCSERLVKKGKSLGSTLHKNSIDTHKEIQREIQSSNSHYYESTKVIVQGYYKKDGDNLTFEIGKDGDKYRNNFINNFYESFDAHCKKIEEYKNNVIKVLASQPLEIKVCFLIEDKTMLGSYYLEENPFDKPVILTNTLQFQEKINNSNVDYIISGRQEDGIACIGYKGACILNKVDLNKKEFMVMPAPLKITIAKETIYK